MNGRQDHVSMADVYESFANRSPEEDPMMWAIHILEACELIDQYNHDKAEGKSSGDDELEAFRKTRRDTALVLAEQLSAIADGTSSDAVTMSGRNAREALMLAGIAYAASRANAWLVTANALLALPSWLEGCRSVESLKV